METKEIIAQLIKEGAKQVKDVKIKNVTVTPMDEYVRLGITIDKEVDGFRANDNGTYEPTKTKVIFVSAFTIAALLKENDDAAFAANHLLKHPDAMGMILSRAKITVIQQSVEEGAEYKNPFAGEDAQAVVFDHATIINHITDLELSDFGRTCLDRLADKMLGF